MGEYKRTNEHKNSESSGIYCITNLINNKQYIGQTYNLKHRWRTHKNNLKANRHHNKHLQYAWNKYGADNFKFDILEYCSVDLLDEREIYWIEFYNTIQEGYNLAEGGLGCHGYKHTEYELSKMRQIQNPKSVLQLDKDFNIIAEWISCSHAGKTLGLSIRGIKACCNRENRQKTIGGYYWIYKNEYDNNTVDWEYLNIHKTEPKRVSQYDLNMNLIKIYESVYQCSKDLNIGIGDISMVCNYRRKTSHNYIFRFTDEYTKEQYNIDLNTNFNYDKNKTKKKVVQYSLDGKFIKEYDSISQTAKENNYSRSAIRACCNQESSNSYGYIWKFKT